MEKILVTGGAGFIGANFIHFALSAAPDIEIFNLDALTYAGNPSNLELLPDPARHHFIKGRIEDTSLVKSIMQEHEIVKVVHFAAETHVDRSLLDPERFVTTNVWGTVSLLNAVYQVWKEQGVLDDPRVRFHHISTDEVFGELKSGEPSFSESTPYAPNSPYSASKAASDHFVRAYHHSFGLPVTITNCTNNYGQFQYPEKLIPLMVLNAVNQKPLPVYGTGAQVRDWLYVTDHCEAIWSVLNMGRAGEIYCIGGNNQPTNLEVVQSICSVLDELRPIAGFSYTNLITFVTDRPGHDFRYAMNINKITRELGWSPRTDFMTGLKKTVQWYLDNPKWVQQVIDKNEYKNWITDNYTKQRTAK